ncbi:MAG: 5'/3'-nucleotidase SurE [Bacteroidales bacterium]|nr:5'/3'-nucleotidase SurE [Bacteroidales bacterium]
MRILVVNDDGYKAQGLKVLVQLLRPFGDLVVIAPKYHQSGMSMAVTMGYKPIAIKELNAKDFGAVNPAERWFYLDGTPASCVKFGIDNIMTDRKPDIVVSGINHGNNAATAAAYSATIGAAMEAAVNEIPAISVSFDDFSPTCDFSAVEKYFPGIFKEMTGMLSGKYGQFYNINFPKLPVYEIKGVRLGKMGRIHWEDEYVEFDPMAAEKHGYTKFDMGLHCFTPTIEEGEERYMMAGHVVENSGNDENSDHRLLASGYITITPQVIDTTDFGEKERLRSLGIEKDF